MAGQGLPLGDLPLHPQLQGQAQGIPVNLALLPGNRQFSQGNLGFLLGNDIFIGKQGVGEQAAPCR